MQHILPILLQWIYMGPCCAGIPSLSTVYICLVVRGVRFIRLCTSIVLWLHLSFFLSLAQYAPRVGDNTQISEETVWGNRIGCGGFCMIQVSHVLVKKEKILLVLVGHPFVVCITVRISIKWRNTRLGFCKEEQIYKARDSFFFYFWMTTFFRASNKRRENPTSC